MSAVDLASVSARGPAERGRARAVLSNVSFRAGRGVLGIIGSYRDGTTLLFDLIDGTARPRSGHVTVRGGSPETARSRVSRVSLDAPLPDGLRVDELCDLAAELRSEPRRPASERLAILGIAKLEKRRVETLSIAERRTVSLALALTSSKSEVILVEEPLVGLDPVAPRLVVDALRTRASTACVIVTTASPREAARLADHLALITSGVYTPIDPERPYVALDKGGVSSRLVIAPSQEKTRTAALIAALTGDDAVGTVETSLFAARAGGLVVTVSGPDLARLSRAITRAIAETRVEVELIEPTALSLDAIRNAIDLAARAASPPPGSLAPPGSPSTPPAPAEAKPSGPTETP
jgi:ABC-type multidrug transport system ATPase subunit